MKRSTHQASATVATMLALLMIGCDAGRPPGASADAELGVRQYRVYCAACHLEDGRGADGRIPPLAGSPWVRGPESRPIRIVLHGLRGPVQVGDQTFNLEMPPFGPILQDPDIAAALTYVRRRFGGPTTPISPDAVAKVRAQTEDRYEYWTAEELLAIP